MYDPVLVFSRIISKHAGTSPLPPLACLDHCKGDQIYQLFGESQYDLALVSSPCRSMRACTSPRPPLACLDMLAACCDSYFEKSFIRTRGDKTGIVDHIEGWFTLFLLSWLSLTATKKTRRVRKTALKCRAIEQRQLKSQVLWPLRMCHAAPVAESQSLTVVSLDADATSLLSILKLRTA